MMTHDGGPHPDTPADARGDRDLTASKVAASIVPVLAGMMVGLIAVTILL